MAARIRLLAWIYVVTCGVSLGVGVVVCIGLLVSRDAESGNALLFVGPVFGALAVLFFLPGFLGGLGLLRAKPWARTIIIVLSFLIILAFPVGTALGGFGLWVLRTQDGGQSRPSLGRAGGDVDAMERSDHRRAIVRTQALSVTVRYRH